ncbi:translation initiation factor IF-2 subunit gamma [Candidatus Pacearchaeota archaeon]|nr:translation initiation factor IF-2 subunit gamma [Candidatus Pacearchaeota archaeon]|tara:strand:- start:35 stop:1225 length:1191 start_codon:yes stop_codon:yes gene_type:complete
MEDISKLPVLNVGIVGHIDHGKTTLLHALTGRFADVHSEELKRGITIKLGYADAILRKNSDGFNVKEGDAVRYLTFVDVPGHEMLMATMLSGAAIIDAAVLVVAANEGIKPQTREHLVALQAKGIKKVIIVQNKIDLVSKEVAMKNYQIIKDFVKGSVAEGAPIVPVSAQQGINIGKLLEELGSIEIPERDVDAKPLFVVARSFDINRPGTKVSKLSGGVLGGALKRGKLKVGDEIEIKPGLSIKEKGVVKYETVKAKILSIRRGVYEVEEAGPGGSLALETSLDMFLTKTDNLSGCVVGLVGEIPEIVNRLKVKASHFSEVEGTETHEKIDDFRINDLLMLSVNTSITVGKVVSVKDNEINLELNIPVVSFLKDSVGIARNIGGHWRLVGVGEVI